MTLPTFSDRRTFTPSPGAWAVALLVAILATPAAHAALIGKIQGRIVATDNGEPIGFADVTLVPADTTLRPVGGLSNADGTFLLEAPAGRYALQIRALSYARKRVEGIVIEAGRLLPFDATLTPEAIQQEEIVVEAKARQNTETSMLAARRKAAALGDAVSAEQVRRSPDKDAAEVLRRVTGLTVSNGKYVFVRGLGERYSSTEVDGIRIASPEQNKRVVPLDMVPAQLLDNITVQKTYTADRPGEFGGGDVQVRTKDFPGQRTLSLSIAQGIAEGVTFQRLRTYHGTGGDTWGFGAHARQIPGAVYDIAGERPLTLSGNPELGFNRATLAEVGRSFTNVWSPIVGRAIPNASYAATYGDEFRLFGRPLGMVQSWSMNRSFDRQDESQRFFPSDADTLYDYAVTRSSESVQLGGLSALSYRFSPRHTLHARGLWTHGADDEVRVYEGVDHNRTDATTGNWLERRGTRLQYVERDILSGTLEGRHEFARLLGTRFDWTVNRSVASRLQPDRRTTNADRTYWYDGNGELTSAWVGGGGHREYGDLRDRGTGVTASGTLPYRLGAWGSGRVRLGFDHQEKARRNFYRRFNFIPRQGADRTAPPESLFTPGQFDGSPGSAYVDEGTLDRDNYRATQRVTAGYVSVDVPFGRRLRGTFGVRAERGVQDVKSFDLFDPSRVTAQGGFDHTDWLPSGNLTWSVTEAINVRLAASRTLSRPDLNELSPSPSLDYVGGLMQAGNPDLERARIDNYDLRVEAFPGLSEVLAAGVFYKRLDQPIEQTVQGGSPAILVPRNSDYGVNAGLELEARFGLGRLWRGLNGLAINSNASLIASTIHLQPQVSQLGSQSHPLQGQARYVVNGALSYTSPGGGADASLLVAATGRRLQTLGVSLPDVYEQPSASLDATVNLLATRGTRVKLSGRNLLDPRIVLLQGHREISSYRSGRSWSVGLSYGS